MNTPTSPQYQQVIFNTSHNSYDVKNETLTQQLTFHSDAPANCVCRGIELAVWRHWGGPITAGDINTGFWTVNHLTKKGYDPSTYLIQLSHWHDANPKHAPVWVTIAVKSSNGVDWKKKYYQTNLLTRLCLVDSKDPSELDHPNSRVVYNVNSGRWPTPPLLCYSGYSTEQSR